MYGFLSDRTHTRWGRRRPWLVIGTPLLVLCFVAFYSTPAFVAGNSLLAYAMLFPPALMLVSLAFSFFISFEPTRGATAAEVKPAGS